MSQLFYFGAKSDIPAEPVVRKLAPSHSKAVAVTAVLDRESAALQEQLAALKEKQLSAETEAALLAPAEPENSKIPLYIGLGVGGLALLGLLALLVKPKSVAGYRKRRRSRR